MNTLASIMIENGLPFDKGTIFPLNQTQTIVGREVHDWKPDLSLPNMYVSRRHLAIYIKEGIYYVMDLASKHGTLLNDVPLTPNEEYKLKDADQISIADHHIKMIFLSSSMDQTADLGPSITSTDSNYPYTLNGINQELHIHNQTLLFSEKEYTCLQLLLMNEDQFVDLSRIKKEVWPERINEDQSIPDVSNEEINALIYRIRKKTNDLLTISNVRRKGFVLSFST
ncbi:FHA domain-containing protein [Pontibacillus salipaludis]|uniref:FHA domain-containing protein n=1 Tax=Pontibacillus salipaludis TaxID=1697394 RepID=UPI0031EEC2D3